MTTLTASALRVALAGAHKRAKPRHLEDSFQEDVIRQARLMLRREVVYFHVPNGGKRNVREAAKLKKMGVLAGVPDLAFVRAGALYFIECKAGANKTTPIQDATIAALTEAGAQIAVCRTLEEVVAAWREWNMLRP